MDRSKGRQLARVSWHFQLKVPTSPRQEELKERSLKDHSPNPGVRHKWILSTGTINGFVVLLRTRLHGCLLEGLASPLPPRLPERGNAHSSQSQRKLTAGSSSPFSSASTSWGWLLSPEEMALAGSQAHGCLANVSSTWCRKAQPHLQKPQNQNQRVSDTWRGEKGGCQPCAKKQGTHRTGKTCPGQGLLRKGAGLQIVSF